MPRMVRVVNGPRTFYGLTGAPTAWQRRSMSRRAFRQAGEEAGAAKKKIIKVMEEVAEVEVVLENPLQGISNHIE